MATASGDPKALEQAILSALGIDPEGCSDEAAVDSYKFAMRLCWERLVPVVGDAGAAAIMRYAIKGASRRQPSVMLVTVTEGGLDASRLETSDSQGTLQELRRSLQELCIAIFQTLIKLMGNVLADPLLQEMRERNR